MSDGMDQQVTGPVLELAAKVKAALEQHDLDVDTSYGKFYVDQVRLRYYGGGDSEVVGYLVPDEGEGKTFDFWTPEPPGRD